MKSVLVLTILILFSTFANAVTYYVRVDGNDSCDGLDNIADVGDPWGTSCAWLTIGKCASTLTGGNTCSVQAGTYTASVTETTSGGSGTEIIYDGNGVATIEGQFYISNADYVHVKNFIIENSGEAMRLVESSHCLIDNNTLSSSDTYTLNNRTNPSDTDNTTSEYNIISNNIILEGSNAALYISGLYHTINSNTISGMTGDVNRDGIFFTGCSYCDIYDNYITTGTHPGAPDPHIDCFQSWGWSHNTNFHGNVCINPSVQGSNQIVHISDHETPGMSVYALAFYNNIFVMSDPGYSPFNIQESDEGEVIDDVKIYNNVFNHTSADGDQAIRLTDVTNALVKNNIIVNYGNDDDCYYQLNGTTTGFVTDYNLVYDPNISACESANDIFGEDPLFTLPGSLDFTLQTGSPAIGAGADLGNSLLYGLDPTSTWTDNVKPLDQDDYGDWEIGAYVYIEAGPVGGPGTIAGGGSGTIAGGGTGTIEGTEP